MRAEDSSKFDPKKEVNFAEATMSTEAALALVGRILFNKVSEKEVTSAFMRAERNDFVAVPMSRGFSLDDAELDEAYA